VDGVKLRLLRRDLVVDAALRRARPHGQQRDEEPKRDEPAGGSRAQVASDGKARGNQPDRRSDAQEFQRQQRA